MADAQSGTEASKGASKSINIEEHEKIVNTLYEELKRKEKIIEKLERDNAILMRSAIKQANKNAELSEQLRKFIIKEKK